MANHNLIILTASKLVRFFVMTSSASSSTEDIDDYDKINFQSLLNQFQGQRFVVDGEFDIGTLNVHRLIVEFGGLIMPTRSVLKNRISKLKEKMANSKGKRGSKKKRKSNESEVEVTKTAHYNYEILGRVIGKQKQIPPSKASKNFKFKSFTELQFLQLLAPVLPQPVTSLSASSSSSSSSSSPQSR